MFTDQDLKQIKERGSALAAVEAQINNFKTGFPWLEILQPATVGSGIIRLNEENLNKHIHNYEAQLPQKKVIKFVPASGAASRMFKALFSFMSKAEGVDNQGELLQKDKAVKSFFDQISDFAFAGELAESLGGKAEMDHLIQQEDYAKILRYLLTDAGLNYGSLPKALLTFHKYDNGTRTALEEHLVEGANYCAGEGNRVFIHLTVSPEHESGFKEKIAAVKANYEKMFGVHFDISFSQQKPSTDTIAVDLEDNPFRKEDGSVLFRPGGHGALIENLNELDADVIFIKNIDNVVPDRLKADTYTYKKALAGVLLHFQQRVFDYLDKLENASTELIQEVSTFLQDELATQKPDGYEDWSESQQLDYLKTKLNRPLRVCGMVKNEGEPGGGPFWTRNSDGTTSLQIAESAQIDMDDPEKKAIASSATHFNPVDLVCATRDKNGNPFDLLKYRDPKTGFISSKSLNGRDLKALELPGLWNGAMSDWNTLFVEVPIITFNPVKTVNDLLRDQHQ